MTPRGALVLVVLAMWAIEPTVALVAVLVGFVAAALLPLTFIPKESTT